MLVVPGGYDAGLGNFILGWKWSRLVVLGEVLAFYSLIIDFTTVFV